MINSFHLNQKHRFKPKKSDFFRFFFKEIDFFLTQIITTNNNNEMMAKGIYAFGLNLDLLELEFGLEIGSQDRESKGHLSACMKES